MQGPLKTLQYQVAFWTIGSIFTVWLCGAVLLDDWRNWPDTVAMLLVAVAVLAVAVISIRQLMTYCRQQQMWNDGLAQVTFHRLAPSVNADVVDQDYQVPRPAKIRTHKLASDALGWIMLLVAGVSGFVCSVMINMAGFQWWLLVGYCVGLTAIVILLLPISNLKDRWSPIQLPETTTERSHTFTQTGFHKYHKHVLESWGFTSAGLFTISKERCTELFFANDDTIMAGTGCERKSSQFNQFCWFMTHFTDQTRLETRLEISTKDAGIERERLPETIRRHVQLAHQRCENEHVRVATINEANFLRVFECFETQAKFDRWGVSATGGPNTMGAPSSFSSLFRWPPPAQSLI